jgi:hypothetical protein
MSDRKEDYKKLDLFATDYDEFIDLLHELDKNINTSYVSIKIFNQEITDNMWFIDNMLMELVQKLKSRTRHKIEFYFFSCKMITDDSTVHLAGLDALHDVEYWWN